MPIPPDLAERLQALSPAAKEIAVARLLAVRSRLVGPTGPYGYGTRSHPTPGAMAIDHEPSITRRTPALDLLDKHLVDVADGVCTRLLFFMPPQEGKSQRVARRFPTWLLRMDPTLRIVIVSYEAGRADRWGRAVKRDCEANPQWGVRLAQDSKAASRWHTEAGGGVYCVGIGGSLTGEPADVLIIDDPVKGRAEAESTVYRDAAWEWWESTGVTRLSDRGRVVGIMTRWHEDDLAGRLQRNEPGQWRVVRVPAVAEDNDPLGRAPGTELQSVQRRAPGYFLGLQATRSRYVWVSVYQQRPTAAEGNLFKRHLWRYWRPGDARQIMLDNRPVWTADLWRYATVDLAASTKTGADWTVVTAFGYSLDGALLVLDRSRARLSEDAHAGLVLPLVHRHHLDTVFVERGFIGTQLVVDLTQAGVPVTPLDPDRDKITRAVPAANRVAEGRVWLPADAPWLDEWIDEHAQFPNGQHDDQVDTLAYGVRVSGHRWSPAGFPARPTDDTEQVGLDFGRAEW